MRSCSFDRGRSFTREFAAAVFVLVLSAMGVCPSQSRADGDPASDVLIPQNVFYPYHPKVSPGMEKAMEKSLSAAGAGGLHLKVAIIEGPEELGLVPEYFGRPQPYAQFLDREISFNRPQQLLVVMPAGFGVIPASSAGALAGVQIDNRQRSDGLTRSAILAVVALSRSRGHPITTPSIPATSKPNNSPPAVLLFGLPAALLILAGVAGMRRGRFRSPEGPPPLGRD